MKDKQFESCLIILAALSIMISGTGKDNYWIIVRFRQSLNNLCSRLSIQHRNPYNLANSFAWTTKNMHTRRTANFTTIVLALWRSWDPAAAQMTQTRWHFYLTRWAGSVDSPNWRIVGIGRDLLGFPPHCILRLLCGPLQQNLCSCVLRRRDISLILKTAVHSISVTIGNLLSTIVHVDYISIPSSGFATTQKTLNVYRIKSISRSFAETILRLSL